uniref:Crumbs homolog 3a n=1 Tax=Takifugu rubripes TaxID=31033 RepID=A0A3B5K9T9_TAKRU
SHSGGQVVTSLMPYQSGHVAYLTLGVLAIVLAVLAWLFLVVKKKRQTEGTYRPSAEEQSGPGCTAAPDVLKLPKEERLI